MRALGLDVGSKTIGVAVGDPSGTIASARTVLARRGHAVAVAGTIGLRGERIMFSSNDTPTAEFAFANDSSGVLAALGHEGEVPSPTFAIVQPYDLTHSEHPQSRVVPQTREQLPPSQPYNA